MHNLGVIIAIISLYVLSVHLPRHRTYPFFEDIYPIPYHGQKSDIISYPLSSQQKSFLIFRIFYDFFLIFFRENVERSGATFE
jgi:hypothetical protein